MKERPKTGAMGVVTFTVESRHAIDFADDLMPAVLATPWLIWFLEHAARDAVLPCLEQGENTVGHVIEVTHLAPTLVGETVTCTAKVIHVEGHVVSFQFEARDRVETVARGFHKLQVIRTDRFMKRVLGKQKPPD